jgi:GDP-L-fucose synthase
MPTNLYGPGDNYHPENSHVIPALLRRFHEAKVNDQAEVIVWGTGIPRREFLYVDDMAKASVFVMELEKKQYDQVTNPMQSYLNVGFGSDITIAELTTAVARATNYLGKIVFDTTKLDGSPQKWMDSARINQLGWQPKTTLTDGLNQAYQDFLTSLKLGSRAS